MAEIAKPITVERGLAANLDLEFNPLEFSAKRSSIGRQLYPTFVFASLSCAFSTHSRRHLFK